jgi:hypothetical protein
MTVPFGTLIIPASERINLREMHVRLEDEYRARSTTMTSLKRNPAFAPLRSDPRFIDLMRRVRLAP